MVLTAGRTDLVEPVGVSHSYKVLKGKQLSHLGGWVISNSLQNELALADLDRQLGLCVLCKQSLHKKMTP